ncbi:hypothetical protein IQ06DRAFT_352569 [Phaeosphaeriaceae sp. SRC1lsM3a]|nr:hypothetical protein IQ06DRAFT_352569 [Stagonospora sp. SRC1lsM3a]
MYVDIAPRAKNDQAQTPVQSMATSLVDLIRNKANKALIRAAEDTLVDHLHYTAVTLAGHEAMLPPHSWNPQNQRPITPSLALNPRVMSKLAANIGLNTSRGRISADDLDAMKFHILTHGDENNGSLTVQRMQKEEKEQKIKAEKAEKELKRCRAAFPEEWHAPIECSPYDTLVDMFIETYGLAWDKIPKARPLKKWIDPLDVGSFAMTRLNNGPGLNYRKMPQVDISKMMRDLPRRKLLNGGVV